MSTIAAIVVSSIVCPLFFLAFAIALFFASFITDPIMHFLGITGTLRDVVEPIGALALLAYAGHHAGRWRHRWKYQHNPIYREDYDRYRAATSRR